MDLRQGRYVQAEGDLRHVLATWGPDIEAYEALAVSLEREGRYLEAVDELRRAREQLPYRRCALTETLAVLLYEAGLKDEALAELESVRSEVAGEFSAEATMVLLRLGLLHAEMGHGEQAREALREFLRLTARFDSDEVQDKRNEARRLLERLGG